MGWALVAAEPHHRKDWIKRFDPRFWTVDFARPMMASVVTAGPQALRVDAVFYNRQDLAGLIWEAQDRWDHPLLAYATNRDFRHTQLAFRWRSGGLKSLDALHGPTLTIEGRDAEGHPRAWFVRLWNYAEGGAEDAVVRLDFDALDGGFLLPAEADRVWAGDIDRMFISLVPPDYDGGEAVLGAPAEGWAEMSAIVSSGSGSVLAIGDAVLPEHGLGIAGGYDDSYHLTPARVVRQIVHLGYRGDVVHYVGMSHYLRLEALGGGFYASLAGGVLNAPCTAWHADFAATCKAAGLGLIWSLSYEILMPIAGTTGSSVRRTARRHSPDGCRHRRCCRPPIRWRWDICSWSREALSRSGLRRGWYRNSRSASHGGGLPPAGVSVPMTRRQPRHWAPRACRSAMCGARWPRRSGECSTRWASCLPPRPPRWWRPRATRRAYTD